jgi:hypothetical protein
MHSDRYGVDRALQHNRHLLMGQLFPRNQLENLGIFGAEPPDRSEDRLVFVTFDDGRFDLARQDFGWDALAQPLYQPHPAGITPPGVSHHPAGCAKQPGDRFIIGLGNITNPSPRDQEHIRHNIFCSRWARRAPQRVTEHSAIKPMIQMPEPGLHRRILIHALPITADHQTIRSRTNARYNCCFNI